METFATSMPMTTVKTQYLDGIEVFYREAGPLAPNAPVLLLLHGFPSSSFQYRNLIPMLATKYRVIAPDLPGFGFTKVPTVAADSDAQEPHGFKYTFDSLAKAIIDFTYALNLTKFGIYIFDYGAPVGFRLAIERPDAITVIISQNGNAFEQGMGDFWGVIRAYWDDPIPANRDALRFLTTFDITRSQYTTGEAHPGSIPPETYYLDQILLDRPGNTEVQLDLFYDYRKNVAMYPLFHEYLQNYRPPVLAIWGKNDIIFVRQGAEAYRTLLPDAEVHLVDGGHFVLENHLEEVVHHIRDFLQRRWI
ncbi:Alpha/Beta hydrolase protein [Flammula alnicola]|nr:Alpha/Beta hydrolase protein [Flammula alnicola]